MTSPICSQEPGCSKRNGFADSFGFPKGQGSIDGIDGIRTLRFSKVVGKSSNEVASLLADLVGAKSLLHVKSFDRIAPKVLDDFPKLNSATKYWTVKSSTYLCRG